MVLGRCILRLATGQQRTDKLSGWIELQPEENFVRATVTYQYVNGWQITRQLALYLNKHLKVTHLASANLKEFSVKSDPSAPLADLMNTLSIQLEKPLQENEAVAITLSYQGKVPLYQFGDIPLPENWIKVSANSLSLTPLPIGSTPATYNLDIKADAGWLAGILARTSKQYWQGQYPDWIRDCDPRGKFHFGQRLTSGNGHEEEQHHYPCFRSGQ